MENKIKIFISHIEEDILLASAIKNAIVNDFNGMVDVFVSSDLENITAGDRWLDCIMKALESSQILLAICSHQSITRPWINFEIGAAWLHKLKIIPMCHGGMIPRNLPPPLSYLQGGLVTTKEGLKSTYDNIASALKWPPSSKIDFAYLANELNDISEQIQHTRPAGQILLQAFMQDSTGASIWYDSGDDQADKIGELSGRISRNMSKANQTGKCLPPGLSHWSLASTLAWSKACRDQHYRLMRNTIEDFPDRLNEIRDHLNNGYHYVSLGVGTGEKDVWVLQHLLSHRKDTLYFPVDISHEMLCLTRKECSTRIPNFPRDRIILIEKDFAKPGTISDIERIVNHYAGTKPVLYSCLGNTIANFEDYDEILDKISKLLRPQDKLLIELAETFECSPEAAEEAAQEYRLSHFFKRFATSALESHTNLSIDENSIEINGSVRNAQCIEIRTTYRNNTNSDINITFSPDDKITFPKDHAIGLLLTRKFIQSEIIEMIKRAKLKIEHFYNPTINQKNKFGISSLLLSRPRTLTKTRRRL